MELSRKHRPNDFSDLIGQPTAVSTLESLLTNKKRFPHAVLLTGPSGCGKTTIARILKERLGCEDLYYDEKNIADFKGIDTIREIRSRMGLSAGTGGCRIFYLDECFYKDTKIAIPEGTKAIQEIKKGDIVFNLEGKAIVKNVFINKIELSRLVKLVFNNGQTIFTTKQHEFLTDSGWVEAQNLRSSDCIFSEITYSMNKGCSYEESNFVDMRLLQKSIHSKTWESPQMLLKELWPEVKEQNKRFRGIRNKNMPILQEQILGKKIKYKKTLQYVLCQKSKLFESRIQEENSQFGDMEKGINSSQIKISNKRRKRTSKTIIGANENKQSIFQSRSIAKSKTNKRNKGFSSYLERKARGQWNIHGTSINIKKSSWERMEIGIGNSNQNGTTLSKCLQSGYRSEKIENSNRSRWDWASVEKKYVDRCKKNQCSNQIRLESIEIYESGYNDESFASVVNDQERNKGWVEFYDLEICGHPSYFANGLPVHNCHKLTGDAQNALLKMLEDPPKHVYFFLATTDPGKLIRTIQTRVTQISVSLLSDKDIAKLVLDIAAKEKIELSDAVVEKIIQCSAGSARMALVHLNTIIDIDNEEEQINAIQPEATKRDAFEIVKALLWEKTDWKKMAGILSTIETDDWEGLRYLVLANANKEILKAGKTAGWAYLILTCFESNWYDSKRAGLIRACYEVLQSK